MDAGYFSRACFAGLSFNGIRRTNSEPAGGDDIIDPAGLDQAAFVEVRNRIRGEIDRILPILLAAANEQDELEKRSDRNDYSSFFFSDLAKIASHSCTSARLILTSCFSEIIGSRSLSPNR